MNKYKVGDKIVLTVTDTNEMGCLPCYVLNDDLILSRQDIDKYTEPLSTYTEPLEAKIRRQAAEITRLLRENKELKNEKQELTRERNQLMGRCGGLSAARIKEFNNGRLAGRKEAWELAKKIYLSEEEGGYDGAELFEIFDEASLSDIYRLSYPEAAAKVAEWEKTKEEICVGDVVRFKGNNSVEFCVTDILDDSFLYGINAKGGLYSDTNIKFVKKTGKHIDIDSFLKQIGGEE